MLPRTSPVRSKGSEQSTLLLKCALNGNRSILYFHFLRKVGMLSGNRVIFLGPGELGG